MPESVDIPAPVSAAIRRPDSSATSSGDSAEYTYSSLCTARPEAARKAVLPAYWGVMGRLGENRGAMNFYSAYDHGFVRVAACTHHAAIGDPAANAASVLRLARECHEDGVALAVFPELTLSGYSIEDILLQDA